MKKTKSINKIYEATIMYGDDYALSPEMINIIKDGIISYIKEELIYSEKYDTIDWTDLTYDNIIDIVDYIYKDNRTGGQDGLCFFSFIYNNIVVYIQNDSMISEPYIEYKYVKSQIDVCDLDKIKKTFNFLNKEMSKDL